MKTDTRFRLAGLVSVAAIGLVLASCGAKEPESAMKDAAVAEAPEPSKADLSSLNKAQQEAVRALVRDTLLSNPEIMLEVQQAYEAKMRRQQNEQVASSYPKLKTEAATLSVGPANAAITIIEFFDYRCPYCHASNEWSQKLLASRNDVRFIFKQLPLLSENSVGAAQAAIASQKQGKFAAFHNALMAATGDLNINQVMQIAASVGLDTARLQADMAKPDVAAMLSAVNEQATTLGISGTPGFVINGQLISGFDTEALDAALASAGTDGAAGAAKATPG
jgi:protein-disulfide isomerase